MCAASAEKALSQGPCTAAMCGKASRHMARDQGFLVSAQSQRGDAAFGAGDALAALSVGVQAQADPGAAFDDTLRVSGACSPMPLVKSRVSMPVHGGAHASQFASHIFDEVVDCLGRRQRI